MVVWIEAKESVLSSGYCQLTRFGGNLGLRFNTKSDQCGALGVKSNESPGFDWGRPLEGMKGYFQGLSWLNSQGHFTREKLPPVE